MSNFSKIGYKKTDSFASPAPGTHRIGKLDMILSFNCVK